MSWIFQGNPQKYNIDEYLLDNNYIYWESPKFAELLRIGDKAYLWRTGKSAGIIAVGRITELPCRSDNVLHPEFLGGELWISGKENPAKLKTGIIIEDFRLTPEEGMLTRYLLKNVPEFENATIIRQPRGTVFRLNEAESRFIDICWDLPYSEYLIDNIPLDDFEGRVSLRNHRIRERSQSLVQKRKSLLIKEMGRLYCEVCGLESGNKYPIEFADGFLEVHHKIPLSVKNRNTKTKVEELIVLCANCHKLVHRDKYVDNNLKLLKEHFTRVSDVPV